MFPARRSNQFRQLQRDEADPRVYVVQDRPFCRRPGRSTAKEYALEHGQRERLREFSQAAYGDPLEGR